MTPASEDINHWLVNLVGMMCEESDKLQWKINRLGGSTSIN